MEADGRRSLPSVEPESVSAMFRCLLCVFATELDDVVLVTPTGRCLCVRCFTRETASTLLVSQELRQELTAVLANVA